MGADLIESIYSPLCSLFRREIQLLKFRRFSDRYSSGRVSKSDEPPRGSGNRSSYDSIFRLDWSIAQESSFGSHVSAVISHLQNLLVVFCPLGEPHLSRSRH